MTFVDSKVARHLGLGQL